LINNALAKHEVLSEEEARKVLEQYKVSTDELPRIKKGDPAIKDLEFKVGNIVKITRKSPTAGEALYYRLIVD